MKEFTKSDLKTGMKVEYKNGEQRYVMLDTQYGDIIVDLEIGNYNRLKNYNNELVNTLVTSEDLDVVKVFRPVHESNIRLNGEYTLLWECKPKELTIAEISEILGYEIKVVK